jgi:hypothetical protein
VAINPADIEYVEFWLNQRYVVNTADWSDVTDPAIIAKYTLTISNEAATTGYKYFYLTARDNSGYNSDKSNANREDEYLGEIRIRLKNGSYAPYDSGGSGLTVAGSGGYQGPSGSFIFYWWAVGDADLEGGGNYSSACEPGGMITLSAGLAKGTYSQAQLKVTSVKSGNTLIPFKLRYKLNRPPNISSGPTLPASIRHGVPYNVSWAVGDVDGNFTHSVLERRINGGTGGAWTAIYSGAGTSVTETLTYNQALTVQYRVTAYDDEQTASYPSSSVTRSVINNYPPSAPPFITAPPVPIGGGNNTVSWGVASDPEGKTLTYLLERSLSGGAWTQIYTGAALSFQDAGVTKGTSVVQWRVWAFDNIDYSGYVTSALLAVDNTSAPVINTSQNTNLGNVTTAVSFTYTVTDADGGTVTVTETVDGAVRRTYPATLGQTQTFSIPAAEFQTVAAGGHTLGISAVDNSGKTASRAFIFTKPVQPLTVTLNPPLVALTPITKMIMTLTGSIPADANMTLVATNNGADASPVWENVKAAVLAGQTFQFANTTATNGYAFNFKLTLSRGGSGQGGHITEIGGVFA